MGGERERQQEGSVCGSNEGRGRDRKRDVCVGVKRGEGETVEEHIYIGVKRGESERRLSEGGTDRH